MLKHTPILSTTSYSKVVDTIIKHFQKKFCEVNKKYEEKGLKILGFATADKRCTGDCVIITDANDYGYIPGTRAFKMTMGRSQKYAIIFEKVKKFSTPEMAFLETIL